MSAAKKREENLSTVFLFTRKEKKKEKMQRREQRKTKKIEKEVKKKLNWMRKMLPSNSFFLSTIRLWQPSNTGSPKNHETKVQHLPHYFFILDTLSFTFLSCQGRMGAQEGTLQAVHFIDKKLRASQFLVVLGALPREWVHVVWDN